MGYSTDFYGKFEIKPKLTINQAKFFNLWARYRRMKHNVYAFDEKNPEDKPFRRLYKATGLDKKFGLGFGTDGALYFYMGKTPGGYDDLNGSGDKTVLDGNQPPNGQPGLWCDLEVTEDGSFLQWNGSEKSYHMKEWLEYVIETFFKTWERTVTGNLNWQGEDDKDMGRIAIKDNKVFKSIGYKIEFKF